jgi:hypothetical protein
MMVTSYSKLIFYKTVKMKGKSEKSAGHFTPRVSLAFSFFRII